MPKSPYILFHKQLSQWYRHYGRQDLPWRNTSDPYTIYVSEIMLQQTQVKTVLERFFYPFIEEFPTLEALAKAEEEAVLKRWQGLGYYNRALNLHKAAKLSAPSLPDDFDRLIALPGIGQNTAHAVLAFAYKKPVPVLEANVKRVVHRIFALKTSKPAELWTYADDLLNRQDPFDYNQAMMDLGAMICTPRHPACLACPANTICKGKESPESYPAPKKAAQTPVRKKSIIILRDEQDRVWMEPREGKFLSGLYGFIEIPVGQRQFDWQGMSLNVENAELIGQITQTYSHFQLDADVYLHEVMASGNSWYTTAKVENLPMSRADEKVIRLLKARRYPGLHEVSAKESAVPG